MTVAKIKMLRIELKTPHRSAHAVLAVQQAIAVHIGGNHIGGFIREGIIKQQDFFVVHRKHPAHAHDQLMVMTGISDGSVM